MIGYRAHNKQFENYSLKKKKTSFVVDEHAAVSYRFNADH